jgi:LysM repeat protein
VTYTNWVNLNKITIFVISIIFSTGSVFPTMAHAGILSSLLSVLAGENNQETSHIIVDSEYNSQTLPLPSPALNTNPSTAKGGGDVTVVGGEALLPAIGPMGVSADTGVRMTSGQISTYIVRKGDTLSQIADMFGVTVNTIRWANDIKGQTVRPGQDLAILPVSGLKYTIKNGGSLRDVVKKYGGNIDEAALFNDLDPDEELAKGTTVVIPDAEFEEV